MVAKVEDINEELKEFGVELRVLPISSLTTSVRGEKERCLNTTGN